MYKPVKFKLVRLNYSLKLLKKLIKCLVLATEGQKTYHFSVRELCFHPK